MTAAPLTAPAHTRIPGTRRVAAFTLLFFAGMWLSKTVHPLYFERHGHLVAFGLSYTAMAVAGTMSVFVGRLADRWGPRPVMALGSILYSGGMALRVFHDSPALAVTSGVVGGLGASSVFIALRTWTLLNADDHQRPGVISRREFMNQAGMALGTGSAGALVTVIGSGDRGYVGVLLLAAGCVLATLVFIPPSKPHVRAGTGKDPADRPRLRDVVTQHRGMALGVAGLGLLMGFYVSLLSPYLPLLLADRGVPVAWVGVVLAVASVVRLVAASVADRFLRERSPLAVFLISEGCCALTTLVLAVAAGPWIAAVALALRGAFLLGATVSQELLQLGAFPAGLAGVFFGLTQSAFLAGDSLGGALGGLLYHRLGSSTTVLIATALTAANAVLVPLFYRTRASSAPGPQKETEHVAS
ncbi:MULTISPECIES: MFS transporter [unclassified Streptomyces]|uniref:MFS transporter n=1 Tax=unclassified Streptomyces TaxID=2593676 RepID=UPI0004C5A915|nr:MFS transporter [Streptomyces sp. NRRL F-2747]